MQKAARLVCTSLLGVLALTFIGAAQSPVRAETASRSPAADWRPATTWVFVVGTLQWKHKDEFNSFPQENRRDAELVNLFRAKGVPEDQIVYIQDKAATLSHIQSAFEEELDKTRPGDLLLFYYCGHGWRPDDQQDKDVLFASYDADDDDVPGWSGSAIFQTIEKHFKGSKALLAVDCCYSGYLTKIVTRMKTHVSYACLTSSNASEESTGDWIFTEDLLDAFHGKPYMDINGDGQVTLQEVADTILADMTTAEEQHSGFITTGDFSPDTVLAAATPKKSPRIGERVKAKDEGDGKYYTARIIDAKGDQVQIHFIGYEEEDPWVDAADLQPLRATADSYPVGARVEVEWKGKWYPAKVLKAQAATHLIHYDDYSSDWDEWVSSGRIRKVEN